MASYTGGTAEKNRVAKLQKQREKGRAEVRNCNQDVTNFNQYVANFNQCLRCLVTLGELREREAQHKLDQERAELEKNVKKKKKRKEISTLSFDMDGEGNGEEEPVILKKKKKIGKNPAVNTSFLPDKDREAQELQEIADLKQEWADKQKQIKDQDVELTFNYWDGSGHRHKVLMKKGYTIEQFLNFALESLIPIYPDVRCASVDMLMFVKADLIIPHYLTFYQMEQMNARGEKGPLFRFVPHKEEENKAPGLLKDDLQYGKVTLRSWYERNKHMFPANRWKSFDPEVNWEKYTLEQTFKR
ncbi:protein FAM50A-A-like [Bolinopsis microptera]|uniref:protein FAM50A-A-like n=1 Tax=Bolinopsis microptera TaxID=2820187 RepID=UPI00307988E2